VVAETLTVGGPQIVIGAIEDLQREVVQEFEACAAEAIASRDRFAVAIPGGSVATTFFPALAASAVDWTCTDVFWTDERGVPPDDEASNYAVASRLLLGPARVPADRIHRMEGELPDLSVAATKAAATLATVAGKPARLDLVLLGVGEDGHIASIFSAHLAESASLAETRDQLVAPVHDAPKPPPDRLTLTLSVLVNARRVIVAAFGASKSAALREAIDGVVATPVAEVLRHAGSVLVLTDREFRAYDMAQNRR
jgi:6-phosphogluconolactonase